MQSDSSRIWTRIVVFISYDDNHYTIDYSRYKTVILNCLTDNKKVQTGVGPNWEHIYCNVFRDVLDKQKTSRLGQ